jgi:hypothetical protein
VTSHRATLSCLLILGLLTPALRTADAHPHKVPAPITVDLTVKKEKVEGSAIIQVPLIELWLGRSFVPPKNGDNAARAQELAALIHARSVLEADGKHPVPTGISVKELEDSGMGFGMDPEGAPLTKSYLVNFEYAIEGDKAPEDVQLKWTNFDGVMWETEVQVPVNIYGERAVDTATLTPQDPGHTWRRPKGEWDFYKEIESVEAPPSIPRISLPLATIGLGVLALLVLLLRRPRRYAAPLLLLVLAGAAWPFARHEIRDPRAEASVLPPASQAEKVFAVLHDNLYRAFDGSTEEEIYDLIAKSVEGPLARDLYGDIYESLILRSQGGVVCRIEKVEVLHKEVLLPESDAAKHFDVIWHWKVHGAVSHLGHTHRRMNQYEAKYRVRHDGRFWKIVAMQLLDSYREDENPEETGELRNAVDPQPAGVPPDDEDAPPPGGGSGG